LQGIKVVITFASALKARRFGERRKELISRLKKGSKKTFKKTLLKIWNKESKCCTFASALKSRAKVEVKKGLSSCEKKKKKIFKKFCRNGVEDYLCCPAGSCLQERRRKRKELKPKGFDERECQFIGIENTVERCLNEEGCRA
jgi:hypothetical protein